MTAFGLPQRLIGAGVVCAAALLGLVITEGNARAAGTEVVVAMRPVDPRALLTGHYVLLTFAEAIPPDGACPPQDTAFGQDGWIALSRRG
ncbi:MAG: GDYXXLXY domain-containing protein, partial [Hyphomonadaceae bacterium]|nr:GDYXXLXY domain-containing protein [Hyphomonadaceae bacterium]